MNLSSWEKLNIGDIALVVKVKGSESTDEHINRPTHGIVLNESNALRDYYFSDGTVMRTHGNQLFYLPKGSTYKVYSRTGAPESSCYAINFDADISDEPFAIDLKSYDAVLKQFKKAEKSWREQSGFWSIAVKHAIYEILLLAYADESRKYVPSGKESIISPAMRIIGERFNDPALEISELARECGISEAYFRRLFDAVHARPPKAYITELRMEYAKKLILSGELSVSEVGAACGFTDPCYFSREFSKVVGVCPSKYTCKT